MRSSAGDAGRSFCTTRGVKLVKLVGDQIGVMVAGAKDDGLLVRVVFSVQKQPFKPVLAHGPDTLRQDELLFQRRALITFGHGVNCDRLAGQGVGEFLAGKIGTEHPAHTFRLRVLVVERIPSLNFRRSEVTVAHATPVHHGSGE